MLLKNMVGIVKKQQQQLLRSLQQIIKHLSWHDHKDISNWVSIYIKNKIINHNKNSNKPFILGLPTGSTPLLVYKNLIKFYNDGLLSFKNVITFNMDEYIGLNPNHIQSYNYFMHKHLFNHIDIKKERKKLWFLHHKFGLLSVS